MVGFGMARNCFIGCRTPADRISNLPCNVIENMFSKLPLHDAVRMGVLSKEWRRKWLAIQSLVFDEHLQTFWRKEGETELVISDILRDHRGPIIKLFVFKNLDITFSHFVDHWVRILSNYHVEELTLGLPQFYPHHYMMHPHLFCCNNLRSLYLSNVEVKTPQDFKGFCRLVTLDIKNLLVDSEELKRFISKCPNLEFLSIFETFLDIDIVVPKLKSLRLFSFFYSFRVKSPTVEEIRIRDVEDPDEFIHYSPQYDISPGRGSNLIKVFEHLPSIKKLELNGKFLKYLIIGGVPEALPTSLNHLTYLQLLDINCIVADVFACAICLMASSPNLQLLEIRFRSIDYKTHDAKSAIEYLKAQQDRHVCVGQLKHVIITQFSGYQPEMEFVKFAFSAAMALQKLEIRDFAGSFNKRFQLLKEMVSFPRASSEAVLIFD